MEAFGNLAAVFVVLFILGFVMLVAWIVFRTRYKKAGPDEALIIYGRRKLLGRKVRDEKGEVESFRIIRGGGSFVWPAWESHEILSLKMMTLDIDLGHVYTIQGIPINVKAVAQVKIRGDVQFIRRAAEGFLGMAVNQIQSTIKETVAGHLRGIIGTLTIEELYRDQKRFQDSVREEAHVDLEGMGFEFRSFVFREIQDDEGYLNALGQPKIQDALKNARIATAEADRDAKIEEEAARQQKEQKRIGVDTEIAVADRELDMKRASIKRDVDVANADAQKGSSRSRTSVSRIKKSSARNSS
jgi:flotillin